MNKKILIYIPLLLLTQTKSANSPQHTFLATNQILNFSGNPYGHNPFFYFQPQPNLSVAASLLATGQLNYANTIIPPFQPVPANSIINNSFVGTPSLSQPEKALHPSTTANPLEQGPLEKSIIDYEDLLDMVEKADKGAERYNPKKNSPKVIKKTDTTAEKNDPSKELSDTKQTRPRLKNRSGTQAIIAYLISVKVNKSETSLKEVVGLESLIKETEKKLLSTTTKELNELLKAIATDEETINRFLNGMSFEKAKKDLKNDRRRDKNRHYAIDSRKKKSKIKNQEVLVELKNGYGSPQSITNSNE